ncbi:apolipoprotein N-acyltransferase [Albidovulum sp.]
MAGGQAPWGLWWLSVAGLGGLLWLAGGCRGLGPALWLGWLAGLGHFAGSLFWIVEPFLVEPDRYGWMAPFALVFMVAGMALFWAFAGAVSALGRNRPSRVAGFAAGLAISDLVRSHVLTGFPWALIGHVWIGTPVAQAAALVGPVGLSALTVLIAALPVAPARRPARAAAAVASLALLGGLWWGGTARLAEATAPRADAPRIRLIQPNAAQHLKWRADMWRIFVERQLAQTAEPAEAPLDLVVWPETAVPFLLERAGPFLHNMALASGGVPIATGIQRMEGTRVFNSLAVIDGAGQVQAVYDKWHLVPFGEYIPFGDLALGLGISAFAAQEGNGYTPGPGARVLDLGRIGKVLPLICYEAIFPQDLNAAEERADWILQITNDGWFGTLAGPYQHLAQARLRAIEQGLPLLRAANTGISAVIDARGRILQSLPLDSEGVIDTALPPALPPTPYSRTGDIPATMLALAALLSLLVLRRHHSR